MVFCSPTFTSLGGTPPGLPRRHGVHVRRATAQRHAHLGHQLRSEVALAQPTTLRHDIDMGPGRETWIGMGNSWKYMEISYFLGQK